MKEILEVLPSKNNRRHHEQKGEKGNLVLCVQNCVRVILTAWVVHFPSFFMILRTSSYLFPFYQEFLPNIKFNVSICREHFSIHSASSISVTQNVVVVAFSLHARIWGECSTVHSPAAFLFFFFFFLLFLKEEISSRTLIPLFRPGSVDSGSASWDDCDRQVAPELVS